MTEKKKKNISRSKKKNNKLEELEKERDDYKILAQRTQADLINSRKRMLKDIEDAKNRNIKNYKSLSGIELRKECINYIQKNIKKIDISDNINSFDKKFDIITMFHVLEHIPYQIETLKVLKSKLKNKGKIIIEVPHAEDFLILQNDFIINEKIFNNKNKFKGKIGIFEINKKKISHLLNFYVAEGEEFRKIF